MALLLLHGALGSASQFDDLKQRLSVLGPLHAIDFSGHGTRSGIESDFSIPLFANDVLGWMHKQNLEKVDIFGYSMGGFVALYLARHHPEKVGKVFTLATKFRWTPEIAAQEARMLDPEKIEQKLPHFAQTLAQRHEVQHWKTVMNKTAKMMAALGQDNSLKAEDYKAIAHPVTLSIGDRDKMVSLDETLEVFRNLQDSSLTVFPATAHPFEQVNAAMLSFHLVTFFGSTPQD